VRSGKNGFDLEDTLGLAGYRDRDAIIMLDVDELLARPEYEELDCQALIGITHDRGLRPSVGTQGGKRHDLVRIQHSNCVLLHWDYPGIGR
jgi:hypothetical protein